MAAGVGGDMIRGHIDTIILYSLIEGDKDSNQIKAEIEERADGQFQLKQGTFYSALQRIVKNGYVIEYRTTGQDGVRRKFFQLTEKGKDHIEQTQSSWTMTRGVINVLMDTKEKRSKKAAEVQEEAEEKLPVFEEATVTDFSNLANAADNSDDELSAVLNSINDEDVPEELLESEQEESKPSVFNVEQYDDTPQTFDDIMEILEQIERNEQEQIERIAKLEQDKERELQEQAEREAAAKAEAEAIAAAHAEAEKARILAAEAERVEIPDEFAEAEKRANAAIVSEESSSPEDIQESTALIENEQPAEVVTEQVTEAVYDAQPEDYLNEPDDFLNSNDLPVQKEYRDVLSKIFAQDEANMPKNNVVDFPAAQPEEIDEQPSPITFETEAQTAQEENYDDVIVEELKFDPPKKEEPKSRTRMNRTSSSIDYSDIVALSEREGFKITTSDRTNKSELGKILINRLNFHSALIFFILIALETVLVAFTMEGVAQLGMEFYIYFSVAAFVFPLICGIIYYMAPKRTVAEVSTFKGAFETALIITLNLILMILVYTVIIDLDFSSNVAITRNLFLPVMLVINLPIYVVIRYSLLEKQMYFS